MAKVADFRAARPTWCPGCGDFGVLNALTRAVTDLGLEPEDVVVVSGIGCSGKISQYFGGYGFHGIHGRSLPIAQGVKLANRDLTVIAAGGDGDGYGIGLSHVIHAIRRNVDLTYIVMDNHIYGLTTGQLAPTSDKGMKTKTSPYGSVEEPVRPLELALAQGCGFVAQAFSGEINHMAEVFKKAIQHKGFSLVNVFSPCVTFNKLNTYDYFKARLINLDEDPDYDRHDRAAAMRKVMETGGMVIGIVYETDKPTYEEQLPGFPEEGLAHQPLALDPAELEALEAQFA